MMNEHSSRGAKIWGSMHKNSGPLRPCDKESALLLAQEMYVGLMVRFAAARDEEILQNDSFQEGFRERPFQKEAITEALSQWILMQASHQPHCVSHETASSIADASAHPMSQPQVFQPSIRHQAAHLSPTQSPIPQDVEASTHRSKS